MVSQERIQEVVNSIAQQFHPDKIILFGSYAYGTPTEDSDVDLLVVMPAHEQDHKKSVEMRLFLRTEFRYDLLVYDPDYLQRRYEQEDWFVRDMVEKGRTLYEAFNPRVGDKSRKRLAKSHQ